MITPEVFKDWLERQGYTNVKIRLFKKSWQLNYWAPDAKYQRNFGLSFAEFIEYKLSNDYVEWAHRTFPAINSKKETQGDIK